MKWDWRRRSGGGRGGGMKGGLINLSICRVNNSCISAPQYSEESWFLGGTSNTEYGRCKLSVISCIVRYKSS